MIGDLRDFYGNHVKSHTFIRSRDPVTGDGLSEPQEVDGVDA